MTKKKKAALDILAGAGDHVKYAMLGVTMTDENGEEAKTIVSVPFEMIPEGMEIGEEEEWKIELDGEKMPCVLLGIGEYDPEIMDGPPTPEEIQKAFDE